MDRSILRQLADNKNLFDATKEILKEQFTLDEISTAQTNEEMGQVVRARLVGLLKVEKGFQEIAKFRTLSEASEKENPAR